MPLPERKPDESYEEFIDRCMADPVMLREFPDEAQRRAVCERQSKTQSLGQVQLTCVAKDLVVQTAEEGQLPRFRMIAYTGAAMQGVAGWRFPVVIDLAGLKIPKQQLPIRFGHDLFAGVGHTESIRVENGLLIAEGVISRDTEAAREIIVSAKRGFPWQASVGISVEEYEFIKKDQTVSVNGRQFSGPVNVVRKATLGEISFVDLGADGATSVQVTANFYPQKESRTMEQDKQTQEKTLEAKGQPEQGAGSATSPNEPPKTDEKTVQAQGDSGQAASSGAADPAQEAERILAIRKICAGKHPDIEAKAIDEGWDVRRTSLEVLQASRPKAPAVHAPRGIDDLPKVLTCALRLQSRDESVEKEYDAPTLELASRFRRAPLREIARMCCAWEGVELPIWATPVETIKAAFSTRSFPNILKDTASKNLMSGYQATPLASVRVAKRLETVDFKPMSLAQLTGDYRFLPVAPDGELQHAQPSDQGWTIKVDTYGRLIGLTRQDIINDDLGAFTELPRQIGRGAALALEKAFWTMVEGGVSAGFFSSANKNVITGVSSAFSVSALDSAVAKMRKQTDPDGNPIAARPKFVAIPPDLEATANQIYTSTVLLVAGQTDKTIGANNPHVGKYEPVVSEFLTGNGASSPWYLLADPNDVPAFGVAFLRGQDTPTIEEADPDPKYLGVLWRGYFDFGVALLDPRGAVRANGS